MWKFISSPSGIQQVFVSGAIPDTAATGGAAIAEMASAFVPVYPAASASRTVWMQDLDKWVREAQKTLDAIPEPSEEDAQRIIAMGENVVDILKAQAQTALNALTHADIAATKAALMQIPSDYFTAFVVACYRGATAGLSPHMMSQADLSRFMAATGVTADDMITDYKLRSGVLQAIAALGKKGAFQTAGGAIAAGVKAAQHGLGAVPVIAIVVGLVAIAAIAFAAASIYYLWSMNKRFAACDQEADARVREKCRKQLLDAGAMPNPISDMIKYGAMIVAGGLAVFFLPQIVMRVKSAVGAARQ